MTESRRKPQLISFGRRIVAIQILDGCRLRRASLGPFSLMVSRRVSDGISITEGAFDQISESKDFYLEAANVRRGAELSETSGTVSRGADQSVGFRKSLVPAEGNCVWHLTQNFHPGCAVSPQAEQRKETASPSPPPQDSQDVRLSGKSRLHLGHSFNVAP